jgi:hypothetical protein
MKEKKKERDVVRKELRHSYFVEFVLYVKEPFGVSFVKCVFVMVRLTCIFPLYFFLSYLLSISPRHQFVVL